MYRFLFLILAFGLPSKQGYAQGFVEKSLSCDAFFEIQTEGKNPRKFGQFKSTKYCASNVGDPECRGEAAQQALLCMKKHWQSGSRTAPGKCKARDSAKRKVIDGYRVKNVRCLAMQEACKSGMDGTNYHGRRVRSYAVSTGGDLCRQEWPLNRRLSNAGNGVIDCHRFWQNNECKAYKN